MIEYFILDEAFQIPWYYWSYAYCAAFILGFAKAGIKGLGVIVVTLMALAFDSKVSTGIVLSMLIVADILAVIYYKKNVKWKYLIQLLPWMMLGVIIGVVVGKDLPEAIFKKGMAIIILLSVVIMFWWEYRKTQSIPNNQLFAGTMGLSAGFSTMIGNLAGAFSNIFFLAMCVPKVVFIGTTAWLFFIINIFKMPFHIFVWETVGVENIAVLIRLIPAIIVGFFCGVQLVNKINEKAFRKMILILTAFGAIMIFLK